MWWRRRKWKVELLPENTKRREEKNISRRGEEEEETREDGYNILDPASA